MNGNGSIFNLANNQLIDFYYDVFYPLLTQMNSFTNARLDVSGQQRMFHQFQQLIYILFVRADVFIIYYDDFFNYFSGLRLQPGCMQSFLADTRRPHFAASCYWREV